MKVLVVNYSAASPSLWAKYKRWIIGGSIGAILLTFAGKFTFSLCVNLITLWFEHDSGYFQAAPSGLEKTVPDREQDKVRNAASSSPSDGGRTLKQRPPLQAQGDAPSAASNEVRSKPQTSTPPKSEPPLVDVQFDKFAATYSSLSERDRPTYIQSLAGKRVRWTGYISQIYLYQNVLYISDRRGQPADVNVAVEFRDDMRLSIGPVNSEIRVSGTVVIRGHWVMINATELSVAP